MEASAPNAPRFARGERPDGRTPVAPQDVTFVPTPIADPGQESGIPIVETEYTADGLVSTRQPVFVSPPACAHRQCPEKIRARCANRQTLRRRLRRFFQIQLSLAVRASR